jgi:serine/threonine protein kinase
MGTGAPPLDRGPPARTEVLHTSERTRVTRLFLTGRTVIRKEPLGVDAERRLRHELAMLERLHGAAGIAQLTDAPRYPGSIVLVDVGGASLVELPKPLAVDDLVAHAVDLARAVAEMHRRGVMHRDIAPANVVMAHDGAPCLVDFALATSLAELRPDFTHHTAIVGTLAYLAPEHTGRTGRLASRQTMPTSAIASTTVGQTSWAGCVPADSARMSDGALRSKKAWAICERPALCVQTKSTYLMTAPSSAPARANNRSRDACGCSPNRWRPRRA